jgi:peroxiredoxin
LILLFLAVILFQTIHEGKMKMKKVVLAACLMIFIIVSYVLINKPADASPLVKKFDFTLKDYNGKEYKLADFKKSKAIVIMFIATECPVSNAYNERMAALYEVYHEKGISFIGINSNKAEDVQAIKEHSKKNNFGFPVLKDPSNKVADNYGATVTPEVYILNSNLELMYHGRIDDSRSESGVKSRDAANALNEILLGKKVTVAETKAFGCTIKRINT